MAQQRPKRKGRPTPPRKGPSDRVLLANKPPSHFPAMPTRGSWHAGRKESCVECQAWLAEGAAAYHRVYATAVSWAAGGPVE